MLYVVLKYSRCPNCATTLRRGSPRFGPSRVSCSNCHTVLDTGLTPWRDLTLSQKLVLSISELIAPSRLGRPFYALALQFILIVLLSSACVTAFLLEAPACGWPIFLVMFAVALIWPVVRLIRLIAESNRFSQTSVPPAWKAGL